MKDWLKAIDSAWRAFWKQYRTIRTKQRNAAKMTDPLECKQ